MKQRIIFKLILLLTSTFLLITCKESTKPETVTFSGTVILEGETDFSGVKVSLYKPVVLDTALVRINQQYPNIGVQISQETEFDHREHSPLYSTTTNASGGWEIKNVTPGTYNVVAEKDSFGWKYEYQVGNNEVLINMKHEITLNGIISQSLILPENSFVRIASNSVTASGSDITVKGGTRILFDNNSKLTILGNVTFDGENNNPIHIYGEINSVTNNLIVDNNDSTIIRNSNFKFVYKGLYIKNSKYVMIDNCTIKNSDFSLELFDCNKSTLLNNNITNSNVGITESSSRTIYDKNIFYNIQDAGLRSASSDSSLLISSYFTRCYDYALAINQIGYGFETTLFQCEKNMFINNNANIYIGIGAVCDANMNNFYISDYFDIFVTAYNREDSLDFKSNYWNSINTFEISQRILDYYDREGQHFRGPIIDFSDFLYSPVEIN